MLAGLPRFETPLDSGEKLSIPFWCLGAVSVLISFYGRYLTKWFVPVVCMAVGFFFTTSLMFRDENYINEMRMVRYAESDNWNEVLNMAAENDKPTNTMVFLKNVALMNEGGLLNRSFKLGNIATDITNSDSLHVSLLDIASPIVYYNYGMLDEAIRLNYEKAIQTGFSPFYLKMLSRCALAKGYKKMVERYTTLLHYHPFYGQWQPSSVSTKIKELQNSYVDELSGIENTDSYIVNSISLWYDSDSKVASEQALFYAMLRYDSSRFWPSLRKYLKLHVGEEFPLYAQEAYILFMDKFPEEKRMMIPVEQDVYERYKQFRKVLEQRVKPGLTLGKVAKDMRAEWGDTYWYYTFFGRTINLK